jgi:TATA-box binding protein (TBP) (component of TFIID and TFIIIB)
MVSLKVQNMVFTGKLPFKRKFTYDELNRLIHEGMMNWNIINEEISPRLQARIEKEGLTVTNKKRTACISVWCSGAVNIAGVTSKKEAQRYCELAFEDIRKYARKVLDEQ